MYKDRIQAIIAESTEEASGTKDWLHHYPAALTSVFKALTEVELAECHETMEEWNKQGPSLEQQQTYVNLFL